MLSEAKHLHEITVNYGEMLHFVQHDNAFALPNFVCRPPYAPRAWS
jgi:hypothetical protein